MSFITAAQIEDALCELGQTEQEVHDKLVELGLKGRLPYEGDCIIKVYLASKFPGHIFGVGNTTAFDKNNTGGALYRRCTMPQAVQELICDYDLCKYPELLNDPTQEVSQ